MPPHVRLVLTLHNHQPVGNFDGVFEAAYQDSYRPFLDVLEDYPHIQLVLHNSGSLLEWLDEAHPEYIDRLREFVGRGQIEILGGPYYEPILACDSAARPHRPDASLLAASGRPVRRRSSRHVGARARVGAERSPATSPRRGSSTRIVDDSHFRGAGISPDRLLGYYLTEDEGRLLKIFPSSRAAPLHDSLCGPAGDDRLSSAAIAEQTPERGGGLRRRRREVRRLAGDEEARLSRSAGCGGSSTC